MFPMVSNIAELREAKKILEEVKKDSNGIKPNKSINEHDEVRISLPTHQPPTPSPVGEGGVGVEDKFISSTIESPEPSFATVMTELSNQNAKPRFSIVYKERP